MGDDGEEKIEGFAGGEDTKVPHFVRDDNHMRVTARRLVRDDNT